MLVVGVIAAVLAALVHVYIFVLESVRWTEPATRRVFRTTADQAETTRRLAFNQGFYNLFLAVVTLVGVVLVRPQPAVGTALVLAGTGSMLAAAIVLILDDRRMARAAAVQGVLPLVAVVLVSAAAITT